MRQSAAGIVLWMALLGALSSLGLVDGAAKSALAGTPEVLEALAPVGGSAGWWASVSAEIRSSEYQVRWQETASLEGVGASWQAPNRAQDLRAHFTPEGIRVVRRTHREPAWHWGLSVARWGTQGRWHEAAPVPPKVSGNRVEYARGPVVEWYLNDERGIEQGFTIPAAVPELTAADGTFSIRMAVWGTLRSEPSAPGAIRFVDPSSGDGLEYGKLAAFDAVGKSIPCDLTATGQFLDLSVQTAGAEYPITIDPAIVSLSVLPDRLLSGSQEGAGLGWSVSTAGDVNGDGYSDVVVGVPNYDGGELNEGMAALYLGTATGLNGASSWTYTSGQAGAQLGLSVAAAGDVNGDGFGDVLVGAPRWDTSDKFGPVPDAGRAYVFHGSASGLGAAYAAVRGAPSADAWFGHAVGPAGDVNGDGFSDVIVGAPGYSGLESSEGRAYVYFGSAAGIGTTPWTAESNSAGAELGKSVYTAGDFDGDGYSDVIVGAWRYGDVGCAFLWTGAATGLGASGVPGNAAWQFCGTHAGAQHGRAVATAGDVNGDGRADVIVGAPHYSPDGIAVTGRVLLYSYRLGKPGPEVVSSVLAGDQGDARFGDAVGPAGDVNGDGYADVIVGAPYYDRGQADEGAAFLFYGRKTVLFASLPPTLSPADADWTTESDQADAYLGSTVATAGDVNGDGYSDVIVGAPYYDVTKLLPLPSTTLINAGRAWVFHGAADGPTDSGAWASSGTAGAHFATSLASAGDVNGDGFADIIVGAPGYDVDANSEGAVFVYHGASGRPSPTHAWWAHADHRGSEFGLSVASAGDVNGDGYDDVIVGSPSFENLEDLEPQQDNEGGAFVYFGSATGLDQGGMRPEGTPDNADWRYFGDEFPGGWGNDIRFGYSVAGAGDVNGDGFADVVVGALFREVCVEAAGFPRYGAAMLFLGSATGPGTGPLPAWFGTHTEDCAASFYDQIQYGFSVAGAGDVNGDGYSDLVIGAPGFVKAALPGSEDIGGKAFVYLGSATGPGEQVWVGEGHPLFGISVAGAGDLNGDGRSDVAIGASGVWVPGDTARTYPGQAHVWYGAATSAGLGLSADWSTSCGQSGDQLGNQLGMSVAGAGDVNGDGYADLLVGSPWYTSPPGLGRAQLYLGSPTGLDAAHATCASSDWTVTASEGTYLYSFGEAVAGAGDVDGDGYGDILVGDPLANPVAAGEGAAYLYQGNGGGNPLLPRQRRADDTAPVARLGKAASEDSIMLAVRGKSPFGRSQVGLEWEIKPLGSLFDGTGTTVSPVWSDTGLSGAERKEALAGVLEPDTVYHWRLRLLYDPVTTPFAPASRWLTM
ncbi:MAG: FG-GAP-like repeat-containing protein, partial [Deferrisomatales bacterium]|nr:FG-GAP-like repeat-containing protein [Deferrisomatales bacterium]